MDINEVIPFEKMSKLDLSASERELIAKQASVLEDSFKTIEKIDTNEVEPLVTVLPLTNVLREDVSEQMMSREEVLANAPEQYDGYFQVPKTIE